MLKRWIVVLSSLGLLLMAAAVIWQVDLAGAQTNPNRMFLPLIEKRAFSSGTPSTLRIGIQTTLAPNGNIQYVVTITNLAERGVSVLPLEFGYNSGSLAFLSAQFTPDRREPGTLRWNDITEFPGIGDLGPAGTATATKTFRILMDPVVCPEGGIISVSALVSGALDTAGQLIPSASISTGQRLCTSLQIEKTIVEPVISQALIGDFATYDIVVRNPAENATAPVNLRSVRNIQLTDRFNPDILAFRRAQLDIGTGFTPISPTTPITSTPTGSIAFTEALANRTLNPGDQLRVRVTFEVRACSSAAGTVNVAEVGSPGFEGAFVTQARANAPLLRIICPNIQVTKRIQPPQTNVVALGENITFTIAVKATGNQAINVVPMQDVFDSTALQFLSSDPQPSGRPIAGTLEWDDLNRSRGRSLQPGETYTVTAVFKAIGCPAGGTTANRARIGNAIASGGGYGFTAPQSSDTVEFDIACPRLDVTKRVVIPRSALIQELGGSVTYEVVVRNTGNLPLSTIPLTDTYDSALFEFVSSSILPTVNNPGSLSWANLVPTLPLQPGESVAVLLTLKTKICPTSNIPIESFNRVGVSGAQALFRTSTLPVPADFAEAQIDVVCAKLQISKTLISPPDGAVSPGVIGRNELVYRITITNPGNITVTRLPLLDEWDPAYLEYVRSEITPDVPGQGSLSWNDLTERPGGGDLLPGQRITFTITFRAVGCPPNQVVLNKATINGALAIAGGAGVPAPIPNVYASDDGRVACPKLEIEKRLLTNPDCDIVGVGQEVNFEIIIRNVGNSTIVTLPMTDTYEAHYLQFLRATPSPNAPPVITGSGQTQQGTITWNDLTAPAPNGFGRDLPPGEQLSVIVTFKAIRSTFDIIRSPARQTINRAGITGARDEYGFVAPPVRSRDVPVRIADADLYIEKIQASPYAEVKVNRSEQITDTFAIRGPNTDQLSNKVVMPGELITYTVRYRNDGPDEATFVRITDTIPQGTEYVSTSLAECGQRKLIDGCFIGEVAPGQGGEFTVTVRVPKVTDPNFSTPPGTTLTNTIKIESGFSVQGATCGIPDQFTDDNTATFATDVLGEYGDAPAAAANPLPAYGAATTNTYSGNYGHEWLGRWASGERSASDSQDPDGETNQQPFNSDFYDEGVYFRNPFAFNLPSSQRTYQPGDRAVTARVVVSVDNATSGRYGQAPNKQIYIRAWADSNKNGIFGEPVDQLMIEWSGAPGIVGTDGTLWPDDQLFKFLDLPIRIPGEVGWMMVRVRLSYGVPPTPTGAMDYGEIEDYLIGVFQGEAPGGAPGPSQPRRHIGAE